MSLTDDLVIVIVVIVDVANSSSVEKGIALTEPSPLCSKPRISIAGHNKA